MTTSEKYCEMNNAFCKLRDAIYNPDVENEKEESKELEQVVETALLLLCKYLDTYKDINNVKSHVKE